jgi:hypothetical protein
MLVLTLGSQSHRKVGPGHSLAGLAIVLQNRKVATQDGTIFLLHGKERLALISVAVVWQILDEAKCDEREVHFDILVMNSICD